MPIIKSLIVFALTTTSLLANAAFVDYQYINKALSWAGEVPDNYMQEINKNILQGIKNTLDDYHSKDLGDELTVKDAQMLSRILGYILEYHQDIDNRFSNKKVALTESSDWFFQKQVTLRKTIIHEFHSYFQSHKPHTQFVNSFFIFIWDALVSPPRVDYSQQRLNEMKQSLGEWVEMTKILLNKTNGTNIHSSVMETVARYGGSALEPGLFQKEMLETVTGFMNYPIEDMTVYRDFQSFVQRHNLLTTDFLWVTQMQNRFSQKIQEEYKIIVDATTPMAADAFVEQPFKTFEEAIKRIDDALQVRSGEQLEKYNAIDNSLPNPELSQGTINLWFLWDDSSATVRKGLKDMLLVCREYLTRLKNPQNQTGNGTIQVRNDNSVLTEQKDIPKTSKDQSTNNSAIRGPFDPRGITIEQFINPRSIIEELTYRVQDESNHPKMRDMAAKLLHYMVRAMDSFGTLEDQNRMDLAGQLFRLTQHTPNHFYISQLAEYIIDQPSWPDTTVAEAYRYIETSSFFKGDLSKPKYSTTRMRIADRAKEQLSQMLVQPSPYGKGYTVSNTNGDSLEGSSEWYALMRAYEHSTEGPPECDELF